ncbi:hypothetical protein HGRIS_002507 [Hohenbuehelia grisea]|uniref:lytic cellulose monooxygenase (C4-dehydrogenating) n=1 Tax=Hohenbuehelia grisea TaxID=104357 RepID=A0ABR3JLW7_9AGAR
MAPLGCALALTAFLLFPTVYSHGFVHNVVANGETFPGWFPFDDPTKVPVPDKVVRKVKSDGPVPGNDPDIACGIGGQTGTKVIADADAGSQVAFQWAYWPGDHLGPVSTYMTSCNGDCTTFDVTGARWFKIDAAGYDNGQWASAKLIADGSSWTSTIPAGLAPGQYLLRHEIIALHSIGQPQYYPSCAQVRVGGAGTGVPSDASFVSFPGLYDNVTFPDIYTDFGSFTIPGPPLVSFSGSNGNPAAAVAASSTVVSNPSGASSSRMPSASALATQKPSAQCLLASRRLRRRGLRSVRRQW